MLLFAVRGGRNLRAKLDTVINSSANHAYLKTLTTTVYQQLRPTTETTAMQQQQQQRRRQRRQLHVLVHQCRRNLTYFMTVIDGLYHAVERRQ